MLLQFRIYSLAYAMTDEYLRSKKVLMQHAR